jgi:hypothetical protein
MSGRFLLKNTPPQSDGSDEDNDEPLEQPQLKLRRSNCGKAFSSPQKVNDAVNARKSAVAKPSINANQRLIGLQKPSTNKRGTRLNSRSSASSDSLTTLELGTGKSSVQVLQEKKRGRPPGSRGKKPVSW